MKSKAENSILDPLDKLFNTEPTAEIAEYEDTTEGELAALSSPEAEQEKDEEDVEIDKKIDTVYDSAINAFNNQTAYSEIIEPRYAARNAEVAAQYLNIALNAAATRARVKGERKKAGAFVPYASKTQNNVVVASREEIMRLISIDADVKELK